LVSARSTRDDSIVRVRIEAFAFPGRRCEPRDAGEGYDNVHVGVQRGREVVELVAGDADAAEWSFEVTTRVGDDGAIDVGGPFVHGRRGDRFVYLSWGTVERAGSFEMFRRAKLHFADADADVLRSALKDGGTLVGRLGLTDRCGDPRCARVRPPDIVWTAVSPG
jgi:uncharacterized protein DUF5990